MTPIADMVDAMVLAGASAETIAVTVRHMESLSVTLSVTAGAMRTRRWREKRQQNQTPAKANDVAATTSHEHHTERHGVTTALSLTSLLTESVVEEEATRKEEPRTVVVEGRKRGTRVTEDFQPSETAREFAHGLGLDPLALRDEFVDFWIAVPGSRGLKLDWDKTYKNRAREVAGRRAGKVNGHAPRPGSKEDTRERTVNALRCLDPFLDANDLGRSQGTGPPVSGQLSLVKSARS